jgi:hypothetical protein
MTLKDSISTSVMQGIGRSVRDYIYYAVPDYVEDSVYYSVCLHIDNPVFACVHRSVYSAVRLYFYKAVFKLNLNRYLHDT